MARKIEISLYWFFILTFLIVSFGFVAKKEKEVICHDIQVAFHDGSRTGFVTQDDIFALFEENSMKILGYPLHAISLSEIETLVESYPQVKNAETYYDLSGLMHLKITQRAPVMRVSPINGPDYYIDEEAVAMPLSDAYAAHVFYVNGYVSYTLANEEIHCVLHHDDKQNQALTQIQELFYLAKYLYDDPFWKSQFVQLYVNEKRELELIPRVGAHVIVLGKVDGYPEKLENLKSVYTKGFNNLGWNQYERIDLRFANQVVCKRK